jgi:CheY-like chemotaxis protein
MMGAKIEARSRLGHGSAFGVTVQMGAARRHIAAPAPVTAPEARIAAPLVLLVEDVAIVRETTRDLLEAWGCRVIDAADGAQALAAVAQAREPLACVITDLRLPGALNGLALVRELRRSVSAHLPAILITADPAASRGQAEGVIVLTKPVTPARLQETLLIVTGRRTQPPQP